MLARHGRRLLNLLDDHPVVPGDVRPAFEHAHQARQVLNDAEEDLREWSPQLEPIPSAATEMGSNLMPASAASTATASVAGNENTAGSQRRITESEAGQMEADRRDFSGNSNAAQAESMAAYK